jgi:tellurite methyltransferase
MSSRNWIHFTPSSIETPRQERHKWDGKYRDPHYRDQPPDPWLIERVSLLAAGSALDLAGGAGRHALWLATRGWQVLLSDLSSAGLALARRHAAERQLALEVRCEAAAKTVDWGRQTARTFDLICVFWFLERETLPILPELLAPGGLLLYRTFTSAHARFTGKPAPAWAFEPGELGRGFPSLVTLHSREENGVASFAGRRGSMV